MSVISLGNLADPQYYTQALILPQYSKKELMLLLQSMMTIRKTEETIADLIRQKKVKTPCHLAIGQEAIAVGVAKYLRKTDYVFGTHRSHAHYLALGGGIEKLLAEVLGKASGCSKGLGGSMHLYDASIGFKGSVPIVAGTIPLAVGAALAAKMDKTDHIAVAFFGDGATEEGVFHEALNFAAIKQLPILFVCENNLYASHLDIQQRQPGDRIARFADVQNVISCGVDGNDVFAVENAAKDLIDQIRKDKKPAFLECITYRWLGHVGPNDDLDVGVRRSQKDLSAWKKRDPIRRLKEGLLLAEMITDAEYEKLNQMVDEKINQALTIAFAASYPDPNLLMEHVYAE